MTNLLTQHPERATNTGHALTPNDLTALMGFAVRLLVTETEVTGLEALVGLVDKFEKDGIPEGMTLGDLLYFA